MTPPKSPNTSASADNSTAASTLAAYRKAFGKVFYSFHEGPIYGIVLNSSPFKAPQNVPEEAAKQEHWLGSELERSAGASPVIFLHHPLFLEHPDEPEQYFNLPVETRTRLLALFHRYGSTTSSPATTTGVPKLATAILK